LEKVVEDTEVCESPQQEWPEERKLGALSILWQHRELVASLTRRDIRGRYKQSALGILWALLQPMAMTIVFTIVMSYIVRIDTGNIPYPIFAYIAMLPWTFFSGGMTTGSECLVNNFSLITKIYFPREVFPISAILGKTVDLALGLLVLVPLLVYYKVHLSPMAFFAIPLLMIQMCLMLGVSFILSSWNLFYRDIRHVMPLLLQVWMYASPIVYPISLVPKKYVGLYMLNPMSPLIDGIRKTVLEGQAPMWNYVGISAVVSIVILILGYRNFKRLEPAFAETI
jgi:ABC-type polysaccharide/polyol phosphate export permease